jgi:hypothetical protein
VINVTDPDSRNVKTSRGSCRGTTPGRHRLADRDRRRGDGRLAGLRTPRTDGDGRAAELATAGIRDIPEAVLADAGYWHQVQMEAIVDRGIPVLIPPDVGKRKGIRPRWDGGLYAFMRRVLATDRGGGVYASARA